MNGTGDSRPYFSRGFRPSVGSSRVFIEIPAAVIEDSLYTSFLLLIESDWQNSGITSTCQFRMISSGS